MNAISSIGSSSRRKPGSGAFFRLCLLALLSFAATSHADVAIPPLHARVTDLTNTLDAQQTQQLESELAALEQRKGAQVVVLMLPTTQPEAIEQYATRVFDAWKIGRKHVDDGVLVVVAKDDHKIYIETGYGLEGAIPDALASRIIREDITPKFRAGDFYGGLRDGIGALEKLIDGEALPPPEKTRAAPAGNGFGLLPLGFVLAIFFHGVFGPLKAPLRAAANGLLIGIALFLLSGLLIGIGIAGFAMGALVGLFPSSGGAFARSGSWGRWGGGFGGWGGGLGGGGFGGGGFGGGGGFSGGGGMTGGGGASGGW